MSTYPVIVAGMDLTSPLLQAMLPQVGYKPSDQSNATTTLANDSALVVPVATNAVYDISLRMFYTGGTAGSSDIFVQLAVPSGTTGSLKFEGLNTGLTFQYGYRAIPITSLAFGTNTVSNVEVLEFNGTVVTSSSGGSLQVEWAQNASSATATTVKAGSRLIAQRVA